MSEIIGTGAACVDCSFWLANGVTPADSNPDMSAEENSAWLANVHERNAPGTVTLGGKHFCRKHVTLDEFDEPAGDCLAGTCDCPVADECECDQLGFSWSACEVCGSYLGGERHAVTFWTE